MILVLKYSCNTKAHKNPARDCHLKVGDANYLAYGYQGFWSYLGVDDKMPIFKAVKVSYL